MFGNGKIYIKEIQSVVYVKPPNHNNRAYYGPDLFTYELIYKIDGENITSFDGKTIHIIPGSVEFLPKKTNVEYYVDRISHGDCIDIHFDTDCPLPQEAITANFSKNPNLKKLFIKMYNTWISKKDGYYYECMGLFYEILSQIEKSSTDYIPQEKYDKIKKGIDYLHEHCFDEDLSYSVPSQLCGISYSYFKRLFIMRFKMPPKEYITKLRMERACELLITKRYSVTEISEMLGYSNIYYFSRIFKETYGCSPTHYKP